MYKSYQYKDKYIIYILTYELIDIGRLDDIPIEIVLNFYDSLKKFDDPHERKKVRRPAQPNIFYGKRDHIAF